MKRVNLILVLILTGIAVYGNTVRNELFWDDDIVNNVYVHNFDIGKILTRSQIEGSLRQISNQHRPILIINANKSPQGLAKKA